MYSYTNRTGFGTDSPRDANGTQKFIDYSACTHQTSATVTACY